MHVNQTLLSLAGMAEEMIRAPPISGATVQQGGFIVETACEECRRLSARQVVNCAGMMAPQLARRFAGLDASTIPGPQFSIGHYYRLAGPSPCKRPA